MRVLTASNIGQEHVLCNVQGCLSTALKHPMGGLRSHDSSLCRVRALLLLCDLRLDREDMRTALETCQKPLSKSALAAANKQVQKIDQTVVTTGSGMISARHVSLALQVPCGPQALLATTLTFTWFQLPVRCGSLQRGPLLAMKLRPVMQHSPAIMP